MNCNVRNVVVLSIATLCIAGCVGGRIVVLPSTPAPSALVATSSSAPVVVAATPARPVDTVPRVNSEADYVWIAGHYHWEVDHFTLVPGQWVLAPYPGAVWVPAGWEATATGPTWAPGQWQ